MRRSVRGKGGEALARTYALCLGAVAAAGTAVLCLLLAQGPAAPGDAKPEDLVPAVRQPAVAGTFYPAAPDILRQMVRALLQKARPTVPDALRNQRPRAIIVPHAGYVFSGQTAAYAYKLLVDQTKPSRVVVLGPSHYAQLDGLVSVSPFTHYRTPLGEVAVDVEAREQLLKSPLFASQRAAHIPEHSIEVQLPFLQVVWDEPPRILPIVTGDLDQKEVLKVAAVLREAAGPDALVVASSDFTHYGPRFGFTPFRDARGQELATRIKQLDMGAVQCIKKCDATGFLDYCERTGATICGRMPIALTLSLLSQAGAPETVGLHYASSGELLGDYSDSVSYYAHAFYERPPQPAR